jgi:hypothetical protein
MRFWFSLERLSVREENNSRYKFQVPSCKQVAKTKKMRLGVGRATEGGLPLNGSPFAEKSRLLKDTERRKEQRNWFAVERSSVRLGESVIRSRARICSSFLVKS